MVDDGGLLAAERVVAEDVAELGEGSVGHALRVASAASGTVGRCHAWS
jgi:hypothetical protein